MFLIILFSFNIGERVGGVMRLLQINCVYGEGSTGKIVESINSYLLRKGIDSFVIYCIGKDRNEKNVYKIIPELFRKIQSFNTRITGYPYGGCSYGSYKTISKIKKIKPDIVHIHCINGYFVNVYQILNFLKSNSIPTVITHHAEFMYTGGCVHSVECNKWLTGCGDCKKIRHEHPISYFFDQTANEWNRLKDIYNGYNYLVNCTVSDWEKERVKQSPFFKDSKTMTVMNGIDTDVFKYICNDKADIMKNKYKLDKSYLAIHVTPSFDDPIKGGEYIIQLAKEMPDIQFLVIGSYDREINLPNLCFVGKVTDQELLAQFYSIADICLLTSLRETFSMVTAESLCCGTPVVGFKAGGPESIALEDYSSFVNQGDINRLKKEVERLIELKLNKATISEKATEIYSDKRMCSQYYQVYKELFQEKYHQF